MNKKIKVIELLNLLAENKIEKATKIKYGGTIYIVDFPNLCGIYPEGGTTKVSESLFSEINILSLNDEVEILEDEEEIDIQGINENNYRIEYHSKDIFTTEILNDLFYKIAFEIMRNRNEQNEILKAVKQLDKKINKED